PRLPAVARHLQQAVVGAGPDHGRVLRTRRDREDRVVVLDAGVVLGDGAAGRPLFRLVVAGQVRADRPPALPLVAGLEQHLRRDEQITGVEWREDDGERPLKAVFEIRRAPAHRVVGPCVDRPLLSGAVVVARDEAAVTPREDNVRIVLTRGDPAALAAPHVVPILLRDPDAIGAGRDAPRAVVLLGPAQP